MEDEESLPYALLQYIACDGLVDQFVEESKYRWK